MKPQSRYRSSNQYLGQSESFKHSSEDRSDRAAYDRSDRTLGSPSYDRTIAAIVRCDRMLRCDRWHRTLWSADRCDRTLEDFTLFILINYSVSVRILRIISITISSKPFHPSSRHFWCFFHISQDYPLKIVQIRGRFLGKSETGQVRNRDLEFFGQTGQIRGRFFFYLSTSPVET